MLEKRRRLVIKAFHIEKVQKGNTTKIDKRTLTVDEASIKKLEEQYEAVDKISLNIISPGNLSIEVNTIMDIVPISTKVLGKIGSGITHTLTGVYLMLTGVDTSKKQLSGFGSSEGILKEQLHLDRAGTPGKNDIILHLDVTMKEIKEINRKLVSVPYQLSDQLIQEIREVLKQKSGRMATESHEFYDEIKPDGKKVTIVKQIAGQGAFYDNLVFPSEPSGYRGGFSIIEMNNMPILLTPNEYRDGVLRAMV